MLKTRVLRFDDKRTEAVSSDMEISRQGQGRVLCAMIVDIRQLSQLVSCPRLVGDSA